FFLKWVLFVAKAIVFKSRERVGIGPHPRFTTHRQARTHRAIQKPGIDPHRAGLVGPGQGCIGIGSDIDPQTLGREILNRKSGTTRRTLKAFDIVQAFEPFRAPLTQADRERRLASPLTPAERAYLEAYGYPYVGDAFRFHMTLTGALPPDEAPAVAAALAEAYARAVPAGPVAIDRLALFRQDDRTGRFRIIDAFPLGH
ncbi:MAG: hypothetical protein B7Z14_10845, partial [Bosea sp. 32-68-6]